MFDLRSLGKRQFITFSLNLALSVQVVNCMHACNTCALGVRTYWSVPTRKERNFLRENLAKTLISKHLIRWNNKAQSFKLKKTTRYKNEMPRKDCRYSSKLVKCNNNKVSSFISRCAYYFNRDQFWLFFLTYAWRVFTALKASSKISERISEASRTASSRSILPLQHGETTNSQGVQVTCK